MAACKLQISGGISTYNNATATKTSNISLAGDTPCNSLTTTGTSGLAVGASLATNASISQSGALTCTNISTTGTSGISGGTGTGVNAAITQAGAISGSSISTTGNITASGSITSGGNDGITTANLKIAYGLNNVQANTSTLTGACSIPNWMFPYRG